MSRDWYLRRAALPPGASTVLLSMHRCRIRLPLTVLLSVAVAANAAPPQPKAAPAPLLPNAFAGFSVQGQITVHAGPDAAAAADPEHASMLREDGLVDAAAATYAGAGGTLAVRAYRFADATGAYAAFTAYREPGMAEEAVGTEGSARAERHLFWIGATLVEAAVTDAKAQPVDELRALAALLPKPRGPAGIAPPLRGYLPVAGLDRAGVHYAIGPAGYAASGGLLPESVIDFSRDAEAATARYKVGGGQGTLTLLAYPTPQMAAGRLQAISALLKSGAIPGSLGNPGMIAERIGPLVAFTGGGLSAAQAHALIRSVNYQAAVTINHPEGYISEVSKTAKLLLGIVYLTAILGSASVLLALFLGGGRVLIRRMRGKPASSMHDEDFISLKLR